MVAKMVERQTSQVTTSQGFFLVLIIWWEEATYYCNDNWKNIQNTAWKLRARKPKFNLVSKTVFLDCTLDWALKFPQNDLHNTPRVNKERIQTCPNYDCSQQDCNTWITTDNHCKVQTSYILHLLFNFLLCSYHSYDQKTGIAFTVSFDRSPDHRGTNSFVCINFIR